MKKLQECFGDNYIGEFDKKYYVWANDGGEQVQISIALTCPKNFVEAEAPTAKNITMNDGFFADRPFSDPTPARTAEITAEEKANIERLLKEFNL